MMTKNCAKCAEPVDLLNDEAVFSFATDEVWHAHCENPMSAVNAALNARQAARG